MKKLLIGITMTVMIFCLFLIYNHKQLPTKKDVFNITGSWSPRIEEVYLVKKIEQDWLTIFRTHQSILVGRLEKNWLGFWRFKGESSLTSTSYPPEQDVGFTWKASDKKEEGKSYYFGQIINPKIQEIKVETEKDIYENASILDTNEDRFFFIESEKPMLLPINIRGRSKTGDVIYSTLKED